MAKYSAIYTSMKKLIEKRYYETAEEAQTKLDTFYACGRITDEEYAELTTLVNEVYGNEQS